jgi:hypothetical protein
MIGATFTPATANLNSIVSNADGTIVISYDPGALGVAKNTLILAPWDGSAIPPAAVDLSAAPQGAPPAIIWKCGVQAAASTPATTVLAKYLPAMCR